MDSFRGDKTDPRRFAGVKRVRLYEKLELDREEKSNRIGNSLTHFFFLDGEGGVGGDLFFPPWYCLNAATVARGEASLMLLLGFCGAAVLLSPGFSSALARILQCSCFVHVLTG